MNQQQETFKLFYMRFPFYGWFENDELFIDGFWSFIPGLFPVSPYGWNFIQYEGSYLRVLFKFLRGDFADE
ncbi:hypothetical protein LSS_15186 [Leptospira santarosai serovar Shermani str. LT 821]|uniref:Uncharacterized protein n=1 Tax=Leptospira santarosai serovar Shermani str. LT 821 TaxID=758847 RepID=K8XYP5_9LEPT|nr:hypothetical protein LSS_15186 [Leptospira santarosai serovar Shermani str. LT 821]